MKKNSYVIHNQGVSEVLFANPWSMRSLFKHAIVIGYIILVTVVAFHFNTFKDAIEGAISSSSTSSIALVAKTNAVSIVWNIFLIFLLIRLLKQTLKMLQLSNRNIFVFVPMALLLFGFGLFISIYLPGWMDDKLALVKKGEWAEGFKLLSAAFYFYLVIPVSSAIWFITNDVYERRISPFISKSNLFRGALLIIWTLTVAGAAWLAEILLLGDNTDSFDYHNGLQIFLMVAISVLLLISIIGFILISRRFKRSIHMPFFHKNIVQAVALVLLTPLAIWLTYSFFVYLGNWMEWVYLIVMAVVVITSLLYSFIKRSEMGSARIFIIMMTLALTIIWMSKFFFEYFWNYKINQEFTLPIALIASTFIMMLIYFKSPMTSKLISYMLSRFIKLLWILSIASWAIELVPIISSSAPIVPEVINMLLMALPILTLFCSLLYWYVTQWRIKSLASKKIKNQKSTNKKTNKNKEKVKEANNA